MVRFQRAEVFRSRGITGFCDVGLLSNSCGFVCDGITSFVFCATTLFWFCWKAPKYWLSQLTSTRVARPEKANNRKVTNCKQKAWLVKQFARGMCLTVIFMGSSKHMLEFRRIDYGRTTWHQDSPDQHRLRAQTVFGPVWWNFLNSLHGLPHSTHIFSKHLLLLLHKRSFSYICITNGQVVNRIVSKP